MQHINDIYKAYPKPNIKPKIYSKVYIPRNREFR